MALNQLQKILYFPIATVLFVVLACIEWILDKIYAEEYCELCGGHHRNVDCPTRTQKV
jgi:hypothetical protein